MRTRSARSSSASFPVLSTFTRAPKILILSVSMVVLATKIFAFSIRFGELVAMVLSRMKPRCNEWAEYGEGKPLTLVQVRVGQLAPDLFDDLNVLEVC